MGQFSQAKLTRNVDSTGKVTSFVRNLPDGSAERFTLPLPGLVIGQQYFMTEVDDPQGNAAKIGYDGSMRIVSVTDAIGQVTTLCYSDSYLTQPKQCRQPPASSAPTSKLQVTQVTDPFGRSAYFGYDSTTGHLTSITDVLGIASSFGYTQGTDFINTLTTPYGTTQFQYTDTKTEPLGNNDTSRSVTITDPLGRVSRVEYRQGDQLEDPACPLTNGVDTSVPGYNIACTEQVFPSGPGMSTYNALLQYRNTFVWNPQQYQTIYNTSNRYLNAKIIHWLHTDAQPPQQQLTSSRIPESIKQPAESRVWFNYPNQSYNVYGSSIGVGSSNEPTAIGRVLDDGTSQIWQYQYNAYGKVTQSIDPVGRQLTFTYDANGIDLLTVTNTTPITAPNGNPQYSDLLLSLSNYNGQHEPRQITKANGQVIQLGYTLAGQLSQLRDPLNNTWNYSYSSATGLFLESGYLQYIIGPGSVTQYTFTYDNYGRLYTFTGPDGSLLTYGYDAANRLTSTVFPDQTTELLGYTLLDVTSYTDRRGNQTARKIDADREVMEIDEPVGRSTKFVYYADRTLQSLQDPRGFTTNFERDSEGRLTGVQYPDGSTAGFVYDGAGRVTEMGLTGQGGVLSGRSYSYNKDNTLAEVSYPNAAILPTFFSYDQAYLRLTNWSQAATNPPTSPSAVSSMETISYYPAGDLGANLVHQDNYYTMDMEGGGLPPVETVTTYSYDQLDRLSARYINYPPGNPFTETWAYDPLGRVTNDNNTLDNFSYTYSDATPRVKQRTSAAGPTVSMTYYPPQQDGLVQSIGYTSPSVSLGYGYSLPSVSLAQYEYLLDPNHNITQFTETYSGSAQMTSYSYDAYNQLVQAQTPAPPSTTTYGYDLGGNLTSQADTGGLKIITDYSSSNQIATSNISASGGNTTYTPSYESFGNLANAPGAGINYTYDVINRLTSVSNGDSNSTNFYYDGLGRLFQVVNRGVRLGRIGIDPLKVVANHSYGWCGNILCVEYDNTKTQLVGNPGTFGEVTVPAADKVYLAQGTVSPFDNLWSEKAYELRDLLGSVRAVAQTHLIVIHDVAHFVPTIATRYEYDPYGNQTTEPGGTISSDFGFAGYFHEATTGLDFARNRVYSAELGRWLTRDPLGSGIAFAGGAGFNATDLNMYAYAGNNPASASDPSGLCPQCLIVATGAVIGAAANGIYYAATAPTDLTAGQFISGLFSAWGQGAFIGGFAAATAGLAAEALPFVLPAIGAGGVAALENEGAGVSCPAANLAAVTANAARVAGANRGVAAVLTNGLQTFTSVSSGAAQQIGGAPTPINPLIPNMIADLSENTQFPGFAGLCAEIGCLSRALAAGVDPEGFEIAVVWIKSGAPGMPCPACAAVLRLFGVHFSSQ
jgi:RHS repeat-associated protein